MGIFTEKESDVEARERGENEIEAPGPCCDEHSRLALRCHLTLQQAVGAPVFPLDSVIGIDIDPSGKEGRSRHSLYVSSVYIIPAEARTSGKEPVELPGLVEVTYALTTLRWRLLVEEPDQT